MRDQWWWISFADPTLPKGKQFLGVAIVRAPDFAAAVLLAHRLGINPGGEAEGGVIPQRHLPEALFRGRLLTRKEAEFAGAAQ